MAIEDQTFASVTTNLTVSGSFSSTVDWSVVAIEIKDSTATAVKLASFAAIAYDDGWVLLRWRTGYEVENLGFHLYREEGDQRVRVTPQIVAGSALFGGPTIPLTAGRSYAVWDVLPEGSGLVQYWLEDVDLHGRRTLHGPVVPLPGGELPPDALLAPGNGAVFLAEVGRPSPKSLASSAPGRLAAGPGINGGPANVRPRRAVVHRPLLLGAQDLLMTPAIPSAGVWRVAMRQDSGGQANGQRPSAAHGVLRVVVGEEGWYRVTRDELVAAGLHPAVDPRFLSLVVDGTEQPILVRGEGDGRLDPGDAVEFYGAALDSPSQGSRTYWLVVGSTPGKRLPLQGPVQERQVQSNPQGTSASNATTQDAGASPQGTVAAGETSQPAGTGTQSTAAGQERHAEPASQSTSAADTAQPGGGSAMASSTQGAATGVTQSAATRAESRPLEVQWALAAMPGVKLWIREEGWYRVTREELVAAGLDPRADPRFLSLFVDGVERPILIRGEGKRHFDAIEFYGVGIDTPSADTRVYWLVEGTRPGKRVTVVAGQGRRSAPRRSFPSTVERTDRTVYFAALRNGEESNFFGPVIARRQVAQTLSVHHPDPAPPDDPLLEVALQGVTVLPHRVQVQFNGAEVGTIAFAGQARHVARLPVPYAWLRDGENLVTLSRQGGEADVSLVDYVRLTYWRTYTAWGDTLRFTVPGQQAVTIDGFTTPDILVVDITHPGAPHMVKGKVIRRGASFGITIMGPGDGLRTLLAFTSRQVNSPAAATANQPSAWNQRALDRDLVIITHGEFLDSVGELKALREGQGYRTAVIDVEDLYDEFSYGVKSPHAIRDFLRHVQTPRFVLLVGDASFDPRDYLRLGGVDFVPTMLVDTAVMETASDDRFADFAGDGLPAMAVGRLPVRTAEEAAVVVAKLVGFEGSGRSGRQVLLVADNNDVYDFEGASAALRALLPPGTTVREIFRGQMDASTARSELLRELNEGPWLVNYFGHGSVEVWAAEGLLTSEDARALTNGVRLPFVVALTCLNGFFHDLYTESVAEALLKAEQGGAVAVWASSGLTQPVEQAALSQELYRLISTGNLTIGEAVQRAKRAVADKDVRRTWVLLGDPTTRLR